MAGQALATGTCYMHDGLFTFDPDTVPSVLIDPQTDRPPDIDEHGRPVEPDPAAIMRSVRQPICPDCVAKVNPARAAAGREPFTAGPSDG